MVLEKFSYICGNCNAIHNDRQQYIRTQAVDPDCGRRGKQLQAAGNNPQKEYNLLWAKNGKEAVEYALSHNPDAVLMDIKMPVMDGIEALKEIRLHTDKLPVIMQTAYAFDTDRRIAEEAGCNGFITKPVMPRELKMYLDKYLTK